MGIVELTVANTCPFFLYGGILIADVWSSTVRIASQRKNEMVVLVA
jgi:hypothetical protein